MVKSTYNTWITPDGTFSIQIDNGGKMIALSCERMSNLITINWKLKNVRQGSGY